jgi:hypothetical protein
MAITPGLASGTYQTLTTPGAWEKLFDAGQNGGKQGYFEVFAATDDVAIRVTPKHRQANNGALDTFTIAAGTSQPFFLYGPNGQGLIELIEVSSASGSGQVKWTN